MLLSACIIIVGCVPRLVDSQVFTSIWLDGCSNLACAVGFVSSGWVCSSWWLQFCCALGFIVSMAWLVSDIFGHKESQLLETMWSVFSLVINLLNYVYNRYDLLYGMTTIFLNPIQRNQRVGSNSPDYFCGAPFQALIVSAARARLHSVPRPHHEGL